MKVAKSGMVPIIPGQPEQSEVVRRLFTSEKEARMPPEEIHKELTGFQKELFQRWIAEGAEYREHWAFSAPTPPALPSVKQSEWVKTTVDRFILARLEEKKIRPARAADPATLFRRVSLDLTGIPPTPTEVDALLADRSPEAYEKLVDRLLTSPRYGERMAQDWLDAARFADSNGYQVDRDREMWAWREWAVGAFNRNLSFDQFTVEQLAGDLLPGATLDQRIATGFHRNHMVNEEGGIIAEEFLAEYCADRVETTATVWLGLTLNCARCHDHKYDPLTQKDFYSLLSFFHNVPENGVGDYSLGIRRNTPPFLRLPAPEAESKLAALNHELEQVKGRQAVAATNALSRGEEWATRALATRVKWTEVAASIPAAGEGPAQLFPPGIWVPVPALHNEKQTVKFTANVDARRVTAVRIELEPGPGGSASTGEKVAVAELRLSRADTAESGKLSLKLIPAALDQTEPVSETGKAVDGKSDTSWKLPLGKEGAVGAVFELAESLQGASEIVFKVELDVLPAEKPPAWKLRLLTTDVDPELLLSPEMVEVVRRPLSGRTTEEQMKVDKFRLAHSPEHEAVARRVVDLKKQVDEIDLSIPITLVMSELAEPRATHVLMRGAYDRRGERVSAATPASLPPFSSDWPRNRLGLARWLVDPANPLTARVTVNRFWQAIFGIGLVRTSEDFGVQGEPPSHPELLDWLATDFIRTGWDVKRLIKLFVMSATYRQDSRSTSAARAADPENRFLARGPRYRLAAEVIRDQALAVSGLLAEKLGGPSVRPYHPPGLYEQVVAGSSASTYVQGKGAELYRRSLYTYWKRSVPNPAMLAFDAPFRETCVVRRSRTSTPLQALNLLNDPTYVEAARFLAQRMMREGGTTPESRIRHGFRLALSRFPREAELKVLVAGFRQREAGFRADPSSAASLIGVGEAAADVTWDKVKLAAYATVASTLLNLDESITKE